MNHLRVYENYPPKSLKCLALCRPSRRFALWGFRALKSGRSTAATLPNCDLLEETFKKWTLSGRGCAILPHARVIALPT